MFFQHRLLPGATRSPETARPRQVPPTPQPCRSPAKERASQPNSASDDFSRLFSRRRQVITTFSVGSTVERSILDRASAESPRLCVLAFFSAAVLLYVLLLYTRGGIVGSWLFYRTLLYCSTMVHASWVMGRYLLFCCCCYNSSNTSQRVILYLM